MTSSSAAPPLALPGSLLDGMKSRAGDPSGPVVAGVLFARPEAPRVIVAQRDLPGEAPVRCRSQVAPVEWLAMEDLARSEGWRLVGVWHSHPDGRVEPTALDVEDARPGLVLLILAPGEDGVRLGAYVLGPDGESLVPIPCERLED